MKLYLFIFTIIIILLHFTESRKHKVHSKADGDGIGGGVRRISSTTAKANQKFVPLKLPVKEKDNISNNVLRKKKFRKVNKSE